MSRWPIRSARAFRARRDAAEAAGAQVARNGGYVAIEGPQFSTRAESRAYRAWGGDVIGMTGMPEAKLAREAELPYASVCMVTDYDCWREDCDAVDVAQILARLDANAGTARQLVVELARRLPKTRAPSPIDTNLDPAMVTAPDARDPAMLARLGRDPTPAARLERRFEGAGADPAAGDQLLARGPRAGRHGRHRDRASRPHSALRNSKASPVFPLSFVPVFANIGPPPS